MNSDYLVLIKATTCGGCKQFTPIWDEAKKIISSKFPKVNIVVVESATTSFQYDTKKFPLGLESYVTHFPSIFVFTKQQWEGALKLGKKIEEPLKIELNFNKDQLVTSISKVLNEPRKKQIYNQQPQIEPLKIEVCKNYVNVIPMNLK